MIGLRHYVAAAGAVGAAVALSACGWFSSGTSTHHLSPSHSAMASSAAAHASAAASALKSNVTPQVIAAEKKLAPKWQNCLRGEGAQVTISQPDAKGKVTVTAQHLSLGFIDRAVTHPVLTFRATAACAGMSAHPLKKFEVQVAAIVKANGIGKGEFTKDVQQGILAAASDG